MDPCRFSWLIRIVSRALHSALPQLADVLRVIRSYSPALSATEEMDYFMCHLSGMCHISGFNTQESTTEIGARVSKRVWDLWEACFHPGYINVGLEL